MSWGEPLFPIEMLNDGTVCVRFPNSVSDMLFKLQKEGGPVSEYQERLEGAWVVYFYDNQLIVSKLWAREIDALRQAVEERSDGVIFVRWGQSVTEAVVEKDRIDRSDTLVAGQIYANHPWPCNDNLYNKSRDLRPVNAGE